MTTAAALSPDNRADILLAIYLVMTFATCAVLWVHEHRWDQHDDALHAHAQQLALLAGRLQSLADYLEVDINDPQDDSPQAMEADVNTDEIPVAPPTVPDGMPLAVQSALLRPARDLSSEFPHPVDSAERKALNAADIEERLKQFNFTGGRK